MDRNFRRSPARLANIAARKQSPARPKSPAKSKSPTKSKSPARPKSPSRSRPKSPGRSKSPAKKSPARKASKSKSPARKPKATPSKAKSEPKTPTENEKKPKKVVFDDESDSDISSVSVEPLKLDPKVELVAAEVSQLPYRRSVRQVVKQMTVNTDGKLTDDVNEEVKEILKANNVKTTSASNSPKGYIVLLKFLLYLFVFPGLVVFNHLSCTKADACKNLPLKFPKALTYFYSIESTLIFLGFVAWQVLLAILPIGKKVSGISDSLEYRLSGVFSALLTLAAIGGLRYFKYPVTSVLDRLMPLITTSFALALLISIFLYIKGRKAAKKSQNPSGNTGNIINDFIVGKEINPRVKTFDFKIFLRRHAILASIVYESLNLLKIYDSHKTLSDLPVTPLVVISLQLLFLLDALVFEDNFLTSFEVQAVGVGFQSVVYYLLSPFIFTNLVKFLLITKIEKTAYVLAPVVVASLIGYLFYRASNYQKSEFRKNPLNPRAAALETIPTVQGRKLIVSGLWGQLRHPNYLGQLMMEWSWALAGSNFKLWIPFFSAALLTITLVVRAYIVNLHNKSVYGTSWDRYTSRVKYSLLPKIY